MTRRLHCAITAMSLAAATALTPADAVDAPPLVPVATFDVPRYMGRWHEIAKYPNRFQRQCVGNTTADYSLNPDGTIQVVNRCRTSAGEFAEAVGVAKRADPEAARLKVRFAPTWLTWLPAVWGDYWIVRLDPDYRYVVVSEPKREYVWIMARTPQLDAATYHSLQQWLRAHGFDLNRLERSRNDAAPATKAGSIRGFEASCGAAAHHERAA